MTTVIQLEEGHLIESGGAGLAVSVAVLTESTAAGNSEANFYIAGPIQPHIDTPFLRGEDYPVLVQIWDNDDDAVFDTM